MEVLLLNYDFVEVFLIVSAAKLRYAHCWLRGFQLLIDCTSVDCNTILQSLLGIKIDKQFFNISIRINSNVSSVG